MDIEDAQGTIISTAYYPLTLHDEFRRPEERKTKQDKRKKTTLMPLFLRKQISLSLLSLLLVASETSAAGRHLSIRPAYIARISIRSIKALHPQTYTSIDPSHTDGSNIDMKRYRGTRRCMYMCSLHVHTPPTKRIQDETSISLSLLPQHSTRRTRRLMRSSQSPDRTEKKDLRLSLYWRKELPPKLD